MKNIKLSIIVPCYNEEEVLKETGKRLLNELKKLKKELIVSKESFILFVDDGSKDRTWEIITQLSKETKDFKGISFSRNYGHQNALVAGLMYSKNLVDCALSIDADLQQDEGAIKQFVLRYEEGFDIVNGVRKNRKADSFFKKSSAELFYKIMRFMGVEIVPNSADYRLVSSKVIQELSQFKEVELFLRGIFPILGFKTATVEHEVRERFAGKSKYSLKKMMMLAIEGITSFSIIPMRVISVFGLSLLLSSLVAVAFVLYRIIFWDFIPSEWIYVLLATVSVGSVQLLSLGIIGEYIGRIHIESKHRPRYIIERTV